MSHGDPMPIRTPLPLTEETIAAYLDGELDRGQRAEFEKLLAAHPEWRAIVAEQAEVISALKPLKVRAPKAQVWDHYWEEIDSRLERRTGQALLYAGALLVALGAALTLIVATDNLVIRTGEILFFLGIALLFVKVLRGRLRESRRDRYERIRR